MFNRLLCRYSVGPCFGHSDVGQLLLRENLRDLLISLCYSDVGMLVVIPGVCVRVVIVIPIVATVVIVAGMTL